MSYQPLWVRGSVQAEGDRPSAERYEIIRSVVEPYRRQFTVWDLGANAGYFGLRLAHEYDAVAVMVEPRPVLVNACQLNALPTTIAMTHRLTGRDLVELAKCEFPDVVLAFNVLHHMPDWREALAGLLDLGERVVIETPGRDDVGSAEYERSQRILDFLEGLDEQPIAYVPSHVTPGVTRPVFRLFRVKESLSAGYAYIGRVRARGPHKPRPHVIISTPTTKRIFFGGDDRDFVPGMNLWNWLQMGGSYPDREIVKARVWQAATALKAPHGDLRPWNVILQGAQAQIIDGGHRNSVDDARGLEDTLAWIREPERAYVQ